MGAKYSLAAIAIAFLMGSAFGRTHGAVIAGWPKRVLLVIGLFCGVVSAWMFLQT